MKRPPDPMRLTGKVPWSGGRLHNVGRRTERTSECQVAWFLWQPCFPYPPPPLSAVTETPGGTQGAKKVLLGPRHVTYYLPVVLSYYTSGNEGGTRRVSRMTARGDCETLLTLSGQLKTTSVTSPIPRGSTEMRLGREPSPSPPSCLLVYDPCPARGCDAADQNGTIPISSAHPALTLTQNIEKTGQCSSGHWQLRRDAVKSDIQGAVLKALWRA
ncbi:hypothetical protein Bbelb_005720 [Branchiostoma belcheri]|nr:hypothetical protein Bbelb_005720 [Branchiostoma belcheri]